MVDVNARCRDCSSDDPQRAKPCSTSVHPRSRHEHRTDQRHCNTELRFTHYLTSSSSDKASFRILPAAREVKKRFDTYTPGIHCTMAGEKNITGFDPQRFAAASGPSPRDPWARRYAQLEASLRSQSWKPWMLIFVQGSMEIYRTIYPKKSI